MFIILYIIISWYKTKFPNKKNYPDYKKNITVFDYPLIFRVKIISIHRQL